jgi:2-keto-4-pentenoate hydratase
MTDARAVSVAEYEAAVSELFGLAHGRLFGPEVPASLAALTGLDYAAGLRLQLDVLAAWEASGEQRGGWKIGLTSRGARDSLGPGVRPHGYVLASRILESGSTLEVEVPNCKLEPEIGLTLGRDLSGADVSVDEARAAVESVAPAFEINSNRVSKGDVPQAVRLGNALNNFGIVMGDPVSPDSVDLAGLSIVIGDERGVLASGSSDPDTLDDPFVSLTRVCRSLALNGEGLKAGQRLIAGSLTAAQPVAGGHGYFADFGPLGRVELKIA